MAEFRGDLWFYNRPIPEGVEGGSLLWRPVEDVFHDEGVTTVNLNHLPTEKTISELGGARFDERWIPLDQIDERFHGMTMPQATEEILRLLFAKPDTDD